MTYAQRLRKLADSTGLDAFGDEIRAIAHEMDACGSARAKSDPQAPLSLIAAPQQATPDDMKVYDSIADRYFREATQAEVTDAVAYAIHQVIKPPNMTDADWHSGAMLGHENEYREKVEQAATRAILALRPAATFCGYCGGNDEDPVDHCMDCTRPAAVPMTDEALWTAVIEHLGPEALSGGRMSILDAFHLGITVAEAHHGITAQAKKEDGK